MCFFWGLSLNFEITLVHTSREFGGRQGASPPGPRKETYFKVTGPSHRAPLEDPRSSQEDHLGSPFLDRSCWEIFVSTLDKTIPPSILYSDDPGWVCRVVKILPDFFFFMGLKGRKHTFRALLSRSVWSRLGLISSESREITSPYTECRVEGSKPATFVKVHW